MVVILSAAKNIILLLCLALLLPTHILAQESKEEFTKAIVLSVVDGEQIDSQGNVNPYQKITAKILDGAERDKEVQIEHGGGLKITKDQKVTSGDTIIVGKFSGPSGETKYSLIDKYRLDKIILFTVLFLIAVIFVAGKKGIGAILGLVLSFAVITGFIVPQILEGRDPLVISIIGSLFILLVAIYLAHGISRQTTVAVVATFITLIITGILSIIAVKISFLTGLGSEDAATLQLGPTQVISLRGLLLGGIIIGALGVLDDVTTTQTASVFELAKTDQKLTIANLIKKGLAIGREHVASVVNTLVLAYAGASLPLFIFFVLNPNNVPLEIILNSEIISEEVVRTLAGSTGLILAVPLTTFFAAWTIKTLPPTKDRTAV